MNICTSCQRYVKSEEQACPFCSSEELRSEARAPNVRGGASRARIYAARAVIAGAAFGTSAACGDDSGDDDTAQTGGQTSSGGNEATGGSMIATGGNDSSSGGNEATGGSMIATGGNGSSSGGNDADGGEGGDMSIPIYGGPFPDMMKARV